MSRQQRPAQKGERKHVALEDDILATGPLKQKAPKRKQRHENEFGDEKYVDAKASRKILKIGQELADEDEAENASKNVKPTAFDFQMRDEEGDAGPDSDDEAGAKERFGEEVWGDEEEEVEEIEMDPNDLETYKKFFPSQEDDLLRTGGQWGAGEEGGDAGMGGETNLADLILEKIAEAEARKEGQFLTGAIEEEEFELPEKVKEVYTKIGFLLSRYKSGKLPKPFKILPSVPHWEEIIQLTRPDKWTPNACYEATKIFVSSTPQVAQIFMEHIILERVREDIHETKKLNIHLFKALKKGLYKPAAWFKGFLFPLVGNGMCTLREAHIISAVLARVSIPVLHSAAALKGLCDIAAQETNQDTEGGGATNIFIKTLLEKKYALPYQVIDALVFHFLRHREDPNAMKGTAGDKATKLPVIWHQCLLAFAQRYRNDITEDQREALLDLLLTKGHSAIGPEVRRELLEGRGRGVPVEPPANLSNGGDDTMMMD